MTVYEFDDEEEVTAYGPYPVHILVGRPLEHDEAFEWTGKRVVDVHARSNQAWICWLTEEDILMELDWQTRIGLLGVYRPWEAVWEYVDWEVKKRLHPKDLPPVEEEDDWEEDDDDDIHVHP